MWAEPATWPARALLLTGSINCVRASRHAAVLVALAVACCRWSDAPTYLQTCDKWGVGEGASSLCVAVCLLLRRWKLSPDPVGRPRGRHKPGQGKAGGSTWLGHVTTQVAGVGPSYQHRSREPVWCWEQGGFREAATQPQHSHSLTHTLMPGPLLPLSLCASHLPGGGRGGACGLGCWRHLYWRARHRHRQDGQAAGEALASQPRLHRVTLQPPDVLRPPSDDLPARSALLQLVLTVCVLLEMLLACRASMGLLCWT